MTTIAGMAKLTRESPNGRWTGRYRDSTGRWVKRALSHDHRVAKRMLAELQRDADLSRVGLGSDAIAPRPLDPVIEQYVASLRTAGRSAKHLQNVEAGVRLVLEGVAHVHMVTPVWMRARVEALKDGRSARTVNKLIGYVRAMLRWAVTAGVAQRDPLGAACPKVAESDATRVKRRHRLTDDECARLQASADAAGPIGDLVALALGSGFRLDEMLRLTWADIDGDAVRARETKNGRDRTVRVPAHVADRLRRLRQRRALRTGSVPEGSSRALLGPRGRPWARKTAHSHLDRLLESAKIPKVHPDGSSVDWHALRHTVATQLAAAGFSEFHLQAFMGWKSAAMARVYVQVDRIDTSAMAATLADHRERREAKEA